MTHDEATIPGRCHLIDPNERDGRVQYAHGCIQTEDFIDENDLTNTCNSQLGISITLLDSKRNHVKTVCDTKHGSALNFVLA